MKCISIWLEYKVIYLFKSRALRGGTQVLTANHGNTVGGEGGVREWGVWGISFMSWDLKAERSRGGGGGG